MDDFIEKAHKIKKRFFIPTPGGEPYLERLVLEKNKKYLHMIWASDGDRDPHDHPWDWSSQIVHGSYREHRPQLMCLFCKPKLVTSVSICERCGGQNSITGWKHKDFNEGDVNEHKAAQLHRLELLSPMVVTLVTLGPRIRDWGFHSNDKWVQHETYLRVKDVEYE